MAWWLPAGIETELLCGLPLMAQLSEKKGGKEVQLPEEGPQLQEHMGVERVSSTGCQPISGVQGPCPAVPTIQLPAFSIVLVVRGAKQLRQGLLDTGFDAQARKATVVMLLTLGRDVSMSCSGEKQRRCCSLLTHSVTCASCLSCSSS